MKTTLWKRILWEDWTSMGNCSYKSNSTSFLQRYGTCKCDRAVHFPLICSYQLVSHTIKHLTTVLINTIHHLLSESKCYMPILLLSRKVYFKIISVVSRCTNSVKDEYRYMSFHSIPQKHSSERKNFYPVGYSDISPFVLTASQNYRTWNFNYSWQEISTWLKKIFLRKCL